MKIEKILSRIQRKVIFLLDGINTKLYMKWYNVWLKNQGIDFPGNAKYVHHTVSFDGVSYPNIHIGNNVVISRDTLILVHDFSIEAGMIAIGKNDKAGEAYYIKDVKIGENCFIGARCVLLGGTEIGDNCIIGAGSVLPGKKYPSGSIIAGNPAKVIGNVRKWAENKYIEGKYIKGFVN